MHLIWSEPDFFRRYTFIGATPSIEYYYAISDKFQIVPSIEVYVGKSAAELTYDEYYGDLGSLINAGIKANYFIGENVSIWGGPFYNRNKDLSGEFVSHLNFKGGFRYYMVSRKNR